MMLKNEPEEDELKVVIGDDDSELIERLKEIIKKENNRIFQVNAEINNI